MFVNIEYCITIHRIYDKPILPSLKIFVDGLWSKWISITEINY